MKLVSVKEFPWAAEVLYELLKVRAPEENISHRAMPSYEEHLNFFISDPYDAWYLIEKETVIPVYIGAIYIVRGEIGIHLFPMYRNSGHEITAIKMLMEKHPLKRYFVNVSVNNKLLAGLVQSQLDGTLIQLTYEIM